MNAAATLLVIATTILVAGCGGSSDSTTTPNATYTVNVSVAGSTTHVAGAQVCVNYGLSNSVCSPTAIAVGQHSSISVTSTAGTAYTVALASNQQASAFCSVSSGSNGVFGSSMPDAVVNCF